MFDDIREETGMAEERVTGGTVSEGDALVEQFREAEVRARHITAIEQSLRDLKDEVIYSLDHDEEGVPRAVAWETASACPEGYEVMRWAWSGAVLYFQTRPIAAGESYALKAASDTPFGLGRLVRELLEQRLQKLLDLEFLAELEAFDDEEASVSPWVRPDMSRPTGAFSVDLGDVLSDFDNCVDLEIGCDSFEEAREYVVESLKLLADNLLYFAEEVGASDSPEEIEERIGRCALVARMGNSEAADDSEDDADEEVGHVTSE